MHDIIHRDLMHERVADLHRQGARDELARAARGHGFPAARQPAHRLPALAAVLPRRLRILLAPRSA